MQVEYDAPSPARGEPHEREHEHDQPEAEPEREREHSDDEHDAPENEIENEDGPAKKKRVTKSRQSLAEKAKGTTIFPLARVKRIIKADKDLEMMSSEATFLIAVATEYFIKHYMEEGYTKARLEHRRIVNYKDLANVVARSDEFEFLRDVTPLPITLTEALELRKKKMAEDEESPAEEEDEDEPKTVRARPAKAAVASPLEKHENLPPLALSTNPLFPNAIVKRPPNTHARGPVSQPTKAPRPPPAPVTPRVLTGKNAPSTPHSLTTRSRRSLNVGETTPTAAPADDAMQVDE